MRIWVPREQGKTDKEKKEDAAVPRRKGKSDRMSGGYPDWKGKLSNERGSLEEKGDLTDERMSESQIKGTI